MSASAWCACLAVCGVCSAIAACGNGGARSIAGLGISGLPIGAASMAMNLFIRRVHRHGNGRDGMDIIALLMLAIIFLACALGSLE
jgi:hypothetical protein